jgi:aspartate--ammonia ligase
MIFKTNNYINKLDLIDTQKAIKTAKDSFEAKLSNTLDLVRVSAPLFVYTKTGLNDNLNGVERPVNFNLLVNNEEVEVVQSLAKWKRMALKKYGFDKHSGLYTDMNAIRRDEILDNIHSIYVDQWDWELVIEESDRNIEFLKNVVKKIAKVVKETKEIVNSKFKNLEYKFSDDVFFITSEELLQMYPNDNSKMREYKIVKKYKTVFIIGIGNPLSNGESHDSRAPDYDDWNLNGDLLYYYEPLDMAIELSSMGIRVNKESLLRQLEIKTETNKLKYDYHKSIVENKLPFTIGGGIGQSRLCLIMLEKIHIGEVQASVWEEKDLLDLEELGAIIL